MLHAIGYGVFPAGASNRVDDAFGPGRAAVVAAALLAPAVARASSAPAAVARACRG
jgi:hypothetical protein